MMWIEIFGTAVAFFTVIAVCIGLMLWATEINHDLWTPVLFILIFSAGVTANLILLSLWFS